MLLGYKGRESVGRVNSLLGFVLESGILNQGQSGFFVSIYTRQGHDYFRVIPPFFICHLGSIIFLLLAVEGGRKQGFFQVSVFEAYTSEWAVQQFGL